MNTDLNRYENPLVSRYASAQMLYLFSPRHKFGTWRRLWLALAESQRELGLPITAEQTSAMQEHLDDIDFLIDQHAARKFGSQGQKRSLAIAVRLTQAQLISEEGSETPILIFDDVLADLDKERAKKIMGMLKKKHQVFIATPNIEIYEPFNLPEIEMEKIGEAK